ncbi:MAG: GPW/gp25 family protein [Lachnospiraceae bacterium]|nr:GPW/gp25 family protein [Lachnospiraceae bacterium]MDE6626383.1 GPW/gp25 family protein [Lachnospiraceae bacterium]
MFDFDSNHDFLGNGWQFPITVDSMTGHIRESSYEDNIKQSIYLIIMTRKGERVMRPDFGCDIHQFMFDTIDYTTLMMMQQAVETALIRWEPRIQDIQVDVEDRVQEYSAVEIRIAYRVRTTNSPFNLVFPFYLEET